VRGKQEVVESNRRFWRLGMSDRILGLYRGRVEEGRSRNGIGNEAQDVQGREVYGESQGGLSLPI